MPKYTVEPAAPASVRDELLRIWETNLPMEGSADAKFRWLYEQAPTATQTVYVLRTDDGTAVGSVGVLARNYHIGGTQVRAAVLADLAVDQAHRQLLPALLLVRAGKARVQSSFAFAYGYPNKLAEGVFERAGYKSLGRLTRYARILRHADYAERASEIDAVPAAVARALKNPLVAALAGAVADVGRLATDAAQATRALAGHKLEWPAEADDRIDELWLAARDQYTVIGERSAAFVRWRYPATSAAKLALLLCRKSGAPRAYAVVERDGTAAHIRDLFGHRDDLGALLQLLVPVLYAQGAASASIRFIGSPAMVDLLAAHAFRPRQATHMLVMTPGTTPHADLLDSDNLHLLDADEDV